MKLFLINLLSIILAVNPVLAQVIEGTQAQNVLAPTNYVKNSLAEKAEASADIDDASNILTVSASSPIEGKKSFGIDATVSGQIVRIKSNAIQQVLVGQNCEANFSYFGDASLYKAYVEQGGTKLTYTEQTLLNTGSITQVYRVNFPCGSSIAANNIVIESTGNGAAIKVDKLYSGEATNITNQVVVTDWQDYTVSSVGGLTGFTVEKAQWRRIGDSLSIQATVSTGTSAASTFNWPLPSGMNLNTSKTSTASTNANSYGFIYHISGSSANQFPTSGGGGPYALHMDSAVSTNLLFASRGTASARFQKDNADNIVASGSRFRIEVDNIPIAGWSATQSAITQQCIQDGSCENDFSAFITGGTGAVSGENLDWIQGNCTVGSNITCTLKTGMFSDAPTCVASGGQGNGTSAGMTSTSMTQVVFAPFNTSSGSANTGYSTVLTCKRGPNDYKPRFAAPALVGSVTSNSTSALRVESVMFTCGGSSSITRQTGNFIASIGSISSGDCVLNFTSQFTSPPFCTHTGLQAGNGFSYTISSDPLVSSVTARCSSSGGHCGGYSGYITCIGAR